MPGTVDFSSLPSDYFHTTPANSSGMAAQTQLTPTGLMNAYDIHNSLTPEQKAAYQEQLNQLSTSNKGANPTAGLTGDAASQADYLDGIINGKRKTNYAGLLGAVGIPLGIGAFGLAGGAGLGGDIFGSTGSDAVMGGTGSDALVGGGASGASGASGGGSSLMGSLSNLITNPISSIANGAKSLATSILPNSNAGGLSQVPWMNPDTGSIIANPAGGAVGGAASAASTALNNPYAKLGAVMQIINSFQNPINTQKDIVGQQNATKAANADYSNNFINSLQNSNLPRTQTPPDPNSYYTYGQHPEHKFFDNPNPKMIFAEGGSVQSQNQDNDKTYEDPRGLFREIGGYQTFEDLNREDNADAVRNRESLYRFLFGTRFAPSLTGDPNNYAKGGSVDSGFMPYGPSASDSPSSQGALGNFVSGSSGGQDDKVDAKLSDGEYVIPADAVAHLGDGNNNAGALRLDAMVKNVRGHKATKKFPPKAKKPESYMGRH